MKEQTLRNIETVYDSVRALEAERDQLQQRAETAERRATILEAALETAKKELHRLRGERDHAVRAHAGVSNSLRAVAAVTVDAIKDAAVHGYNGVQQGATPPPAPRVANGAPPRPRVPQPAQQPRRAVLMSRRVELESIGVDLVGR